MNYSLLAFLSLFAICSSGFLFAAFRFQVRPANHRPAYQDARNHHQSSYQNQKQQQQQQDVQHFNDSTLSNVSTSVSNDDDDKQKVDGKGKKKDMMDVVESLVPLYGWVQIRSLITRPNFQFVLDWLDENPDVYDKLNTRLRRVGVRMPKRGITGKTPLNLKAVTDDDFRWLNQLVGATATLKDFVDKDVTKNANDLFETHPDLEKQLRERGKKLGIVVAIHIDMPKVKTQLFDTFVPVLPSLISKSMKVLLFGGRRSV
jgi:hypothetical protein